MSVSIVATGLYTSADTVQILVTVGVLLVLAVVGGIVIFALRRRALGRHESAEPEAGGMLDELRRMRDAGALSDEQFEEARLKMAARATGMPIDELRRKSVERAGGRIADPGLDLMGRPLPTGPKGNAASGEGSARTETDADSDPASGPEGGSD